MKERPILRHHNRIKKLRNEAGMTLKQLGDKLDIRDNTLSQYENEKRYPDEKIWIKLAEYFDVSVQYLKGIETSQDRGTIDDVEFFIANTKFSDNPEKDKSIKMALSTSFFSLSEEIDSLEKRVRRLEKALTSDTNR